jgi:hypothetical protein
MHHLFGERGVSSRHDNPVADDDLRADSVHERSGEK